MELSSFHDDDKTEIAISNTIQHRKDGGGDPSIEPWADNSKNKVKTVQAKRKEKQLKYIGDRGASEKKSSINQKIEQIYRKYSKDGINTSREINQINSREMYRQQLRQFQGGLEFKQIGSRRQPFKEETDEVQKLAFQMLRNKMYSNVYCCDYKEVKMPKGNDKKIIQESNMKRSDNFQRMLKIKDRIRRRNSLAVTRSKEQYQSEYQPFLQSSQKQIQSERQTPASKEKARTKIKMRTTFTKTKSKFQQIGGNQMQIIGIFSNANVYAISNNDQNIQEQGSNWKKQQDFRNRTFQFSQR